MRNVIDLEARLVRLEQRERRWRMVAGLLATTLGVAALSGSVWKDHPRVDVRELRLLDDQGHPRMLLTLTAEGHPKVLMTDADGRVRAQYGSEALSFEDRGTPRAVLGANGVQLFDQEGLKQADLSVGRGESFLTLWNRPAKGFVRIGISKTGEKFVTPSTSAQASP